MPYPNLGALQPAFDQYGNTYGINPMVQRGTSGAMASGQSLFSATLRESARTAAHSHSRSSPFPPAACFS